MQTFKLTLEYDGSRFSGWQDQVNARTVQGELKQAAAELFHTEFDLQGAGRTDAGVHAVGQVAHLKFRDKKLKFSAPKILRDLNDKLPASIAITELEEVAPRFHARHDAVSRAYFYQISTRKAALSKRYVWWIKEDLEISKMQSAAALLKGRHDFIQFRAKDPSKPDDSTIVVVEAAEVAPDDHLIVFRIEASHYLWKMVRRLTGVLVKVGTGEVTQDQFETLLNARPVKNVDVAALTAPPSGLFLEGIRY
jgi:tRNA pseudouridine38-40 synthase